MEKNNSKVSVIVPVYNVEQYLRKCVDSILNQSYTNLEIILVDDGSKDGSYGICEEYRAKDDRVIVIHKVNGGLSDARNAGLDIATGEYIAFIDSDDYYADDAIENLVSGTIDGKADIVCMGTTVVGADYSFISNSKMIEEIVSSREYFCGICNCEEDTAVYTKLFKRSVIGKLRFRKGRLNEDFLFLLSLLFDDLQIKTLAYNGYYYYQREGSITHSGNRRSIYDALENCMEIMHVASERDASLLESVARMGIHQATVMVRVLPEEKIRKDNQNLMQAVKCLKMCSPYISPVKLSLYEKSIARCTLIAPVFTAKFLRFVRRLFRR